MPDLKREFLNFLIDNGALKFGQFTLKSGSSSPFFIDIGQINTGKQLGAFGRFLAQFLMGHFPDVTMLCGPAYKGISMATVTAESIWNLYRRDVGVFYNRKEEKDHGEGGIFYGKIPSKDDKIVIVDDVITDGATKLACFHQIEKSFSVRPSGVFVSVNRSLQPISYEFKVGAVVRLRDICDYLVEIGDEEHENLLLDFIGSLLAK